MLTSSIDILLSTSSTTHINAPLRLKAAVYKKQKINYYGIVSLLTCGIKNIACIAIKNHQQIEGCYSGNKTKSMSNDTGIKYFLTRNSCLSDFQITKLIDQLSTKNLK